jgi:predicted ArsR family transcriptional regulator
MKPVRHRIIDHLKEHRIASAAELSLILDLTAADVRHHIAFLIQQGTIVVAGYRRMKHRGRPAALFALSDQVSRNNLDKLSHHLLAQLLKESSPTEYQGSLREIALLFTSGTHLSSLNNTRRIYQAVKYLKDMNYDASWEAHSRSPKLILNHCPYAAIVAGHPEMCQIDAYLLELLTGKPVQQVEKLSSALQGLPRCVFIIQDQMSPVSNQNISYS